MYLIIAKNSNYDGYQRGLASIVYIYIYIFFLIKRLPAQLSKIKIYQTKKYLNQLVEKLNKVYSPLTDNIWGAALADMQLISKFNKGFRLSLCYWYFQ